MYICWVCEKEKIISFHMIHYFKPHEFASQQELMTFVRHQIELFDYRIQ